MLDYVSRVLPEVQEQTTNNNRIVFGLSKLGRQMDGYYNITRLPI